MFLHMVRMKQNWENKVEKINQFLKINPKNVNFIGVRFSYGVEE